MSQEDPKDDLLCNNTDRFWERVSLTPLLSVRCAVVSSAAARSGRGNLACRHSVNSWPGRPGNEHKRCFMQHLFQLSPHFHGSFEETSCHEKISSSYNSLLFSVKEFPSFILPLISHTVPQNIFVPFLKDRGRQTAWISIYSPFYMRILIQKRD